MSREYCVYKHIFPNGKMYIGISKDAEKRWNNGNGYKTQKKMANAIKKYGWDNIRHEIIIDELDELTAKRLEQIFIQIFDTIKNGYNVSIGGDNISGNYLNDYLCKMCQYYRRYGLPKHKIVFKDGTEQIIAELCYEDRFDKGCSEFWNNASYAIIHKHGYFSPTNEYDVIKFWFHMLQFYDLFLRVEDGQDVSEWEEETLEQHIIKDLLQ